ncbi:MAG: OmpH family outer membrane protein [Chitinophagaceae bacterium]|jgi:outer membrane protein|nr:OmpH family outer membrane protein [Flavisolibacter sp.]
MKNGLLIFNIVLLALIGVLFFLHFSGNKTKVKSETSVTGKNVEAQDFKIAYFEMDSLESSFELVKEVKNELGKKEEAINNELSRMEKNYRNKVTTYQQQGATMTQVQSENAQRDVMQMQQNMQSRKQALDNEYQEFYMRKMKQVKTEIENFLQKYNSGKGYSYIFAYEPGLFYYRDTAYNITNDVIRGLNDELTKKK